MYKLSLCTAKNHYFRSRNVQTQSLHNNNKITILEAEMYKLSLCTAKHHYLEAEMYNLSLCTAKNHHFRSRNVQTPCTAKNHYFRSRNVQTKSLALHQPQAHHEKLPAKQRRSRRVTRVHATSPSAGFGSKTVPSSDVKFQSQINLSCQTR